VTGKPVSANKERLNVKGLKVEGLGLQPVTFDRIWVVPRRQPFVPDVDEGIFVFIGLWTIDDGPYRLVHRQKEKEAQMKKGIHINYIFWKEGPLPFDFAQSKLPYLLAGSDRC
jgi:hypothetical protein